MRFHFAGNYNGQVETLPNQRTEPNAVKFREPSPEKFSQIGSILSVLIAAAAFGLAFLRAGNTEFIDVTGLLLACISLIPHEILHAVCFRSDVYFYFFLKGGMAFVVGDEDFERWRFVFMSMLPNLVFGFIPYLIFMIEPVHTLLGTMGALAIGMGAGDYINVYNALTQVHKKAKIYMYQMGTFWYQ